MATSTTKKPPVIKKGKDITDEPEVVLEKVEEISKEDQTMALATIKPADIAHLKEIDLKIEKYKKEYVGLTIADENDAEGYEAVRLALGDMRPTRTSLQLEKKSVTAPYRNAVAFINQQYAEKINAIAILEAPLKERKKEIDDIEERLKEEKKQAEETRLNNRINELLNNGMAFSGEFYCISAPELGVTELSVGVVDIRAMSDDLYKGILQQVIDKNATIKSETERIQKEKEAAYLFQQKQEEEARIELAKQQEALRLEREAMEKEKAEMQLERDRIEKDKQEEEDRKQREANERIQKVKDARHAELKSLGMEWELIRNEYWFGNITVSEQEITELGPEQWKDLFDTTSDLVKVAKIKIEEKKAEERKAEEKRIADKAIADKLEADRQEQLRKDAELAAANDKTKWKNVIEQLQAVKIPEMTTQAGIKKANALKEYIANL